MDERMRSGASDDGCEEQYASEITTRVCLTRYSTHSGTLLASRDVNRCFFEVLPLSQANQLADRLLYLPDSNRMPFDQAPRHLPVPLVYARGTSKSQLAASALQSSVRAAHEPDLGFPIE
jgi:hypothetical protein